MAYFSKEDKAKVTPLIKAVLKKYGVKGSIAVNHYTTLVVNIKSGKLDFIGADKKVQEFQTRHYFRQGDKIEERTYLQVNTFSIAESLRKVEENTMADFFEELLTAMRSAGWYNRSDAQIDYFDIAYFMDVNVGKWNKPYVLN